MDRKNAWFLNFDAEDELARPAGYTPSRAMLARMAALVERVRGLLGPGDVVIGEGQSGALGGSTEDWPRGEGQSPGEEASKGGEPPREKGMFRGLSWCPTPRARRALERVGVALEPAPPLDVLRAVNHRRFSATLGQTLPGARFAVTAEEVGAALGGDSPSGRWLLKRAYGYAGRGRLEVEPSRSGDLERARTWVEASLRAGGGLQVEPRVDRCDDFAIHGYLHAGGDGASGVTVVLGEPTRQTCDASGAWGGSARAEPGDLSPEEREALFTEARRAATALQQAGYFGPFGVDAFRWTDAAEGRRFNARCEINARYSMGWAVGMGDRRPDLERGSGSGT